MGQGAAARLQALWTLSRAWLLYVLRWYLMGVGRSGWPHATVSAPSSIPSLGVAPLGSSFSNGSRSGSSITSIVDAFESLASLRAQVVLDGSRPIWLAACYSIGAVIHSLPGRRAARKLVSVSYPGDRLLCGFELGAAPEHRMHDDGKPPCESNPRLSHRRPPCERQRPVLQLQEGARPVGAKEGAAPVSLRTQSRREPRAKLYVAELRFREVTKPAPAVAS
ncbi:hypothetical protein SAMN05216228_100466 [Rhizobium tibeticum]|uniref:Uncharacterized protein n=1 Tax=Rhizobium tibeticum TaxID=501024 RepID=A0ABY1AH69_9HYPH|nr:hypothetical protein SAMN05216228_100466 [Rhizobium tibeticum]